MKTSESITKILPALFKAKSELKALTKGAENPYFSSTYVDLNTVLEEVEPVLEKNGMIVLQPVNGKSVETIIIHDSGEFISSEMDMVLDKNTMQAVGSAVSYSRRYTLMSLLSLKALDDDANSATFDRPPAPKVTNKPAQGVTKTTSVELAKPNVALTGELVVNTDGVVHAKRVETKTEAKATTSGFKRPVAKNVAAKTVASTQTSEFDI
jgi:hypothetical protein